MNKRPLWESLFSTRIRDHRLALGVARRTVARWRHWWREQFPLTPLWRWGCARFMPPVPQAQLPGALIERFTGPAHEALMRLLVWLCPVTVRSRIDRSDRPG